MPLVCGGVGGHGLGGSELARRAEKARPCQAQAEQVEHAAGGQAVFQLLEVRTSHRTRPDFLLDAATQRTMHGLFLRDQFEMTNWHSGTLPSERNAPSLGRPFFITLPNAGTWTISNMTYLSHYNTCG